jgi:hypothetical protein
VALLRELHRLGDRRVRRHAPHVEELIGAKAEQVGQVAVEPRDAAAHARREDVVHPPATAQHPPHELLRPPAIARIEREGAAVEGGVEQHPLPKVGQGVGGGDAGLSDHGERGRHTLAI